jgi:hypothetical protein
LSPFDYSSERVIEEGRFSLPSRWPCKAHVKSVALKKQINPMGYMISGNFVLLHIKISQQTSNQIFNEILHTVCEENRLMINQSNSDILSTLQNLVQETRKYTIFVKQETNQKVANHVICPMGIQLVSTNKLNYHI